MERFLFDDMIPCDREALYKVRAEIVAKSLELLKEAAAIITAKAPGEAAAFKGWLRHISQSVAEASKEGGFLGFGGVQISPAEKATLAQISANLGLSVLKLSTGGCGKSRAPLGPTLSYVMTVQSQLGNTPCTIKLCGSWGFRLS